jgi:serine/threonine-protein kinase
MLDGTGQARITDFGLAVAEREREAPGELSGTLAYMAPERLAGSPASVQSDLYALGLVLYEIFAGRRPFEARTLSEWRRAHAEDVPSPPSRFAADMHPAVEGAILHCLAKDPGARPRSVAQLMAELPGGDVLEAMVAAGQTPSPDLVGASGEKGTLAPGAALRRLGAAIAGLAVAVALARSGQLFNLLPAGKSPLVLVDRAQEIAAAHRGSQPAGDSAWWLFAPRSHRSWLRRTSPSQERYRGIGQAEPTPVLLYYRESPRPLVPAPFARRVTYHDPPLFFSGEVAVGLDLHGHLVHLAAVARENDGPGRSPEPDWRSLFQAAGMPIESFTPTPPEALRGVPRETRRA